MEIDQALLEAALIGYQRQKDQLEEKIAEIQGLLGGAAVSTSGQGHTTREMSASARARIGAAQKKRWAAYHEANQGTPGPKRHMSPAARKRIADATRKRWIAYRAQKAAAQKS
jgi:hypothetical protein